MNIGSKKLFFAVILLFAVMALAVPYASLAQDTDRRDTDSKWCGESAYIAVPCFFDEDVGFAGASSFGSLMLTVLQLFLLVIGSLSVLFLMIGGIRYVTAHGNEEQAEGAKKTMTHAIIGLVIVVMAFATITIITNILIVGGI